MSALRLVAELEPVDPPTRTDCLCIACGHFGAKLQFRAGVLGDYGLHKPCIKAFRAHRSARAKEVA